MSIALGRDDDYYCFQCEEELQINREQLLFATKVSDMHCSKCGMMYELEFPITGDGHPILRQIGYGGEW